MGVVYSNSSNVTKEWNTIGNAAPVQLKLSGRILLPFCRNNLEVLQTWSDDDGETWALPVAVPQATRSHWQWVGTGPPGAIQLLSGRIVVPSYHSVVHDTNGEISRSHLMLNDDPLGAADKWRIGGVVPALAHFGFFLTNECQAVEIAPDHILLAARGFLLHRIQAMSVDGGESFQDPYTISITEPLEGCAGSIIQHPSGTLYYSGTVNADPKRFNMTLWSSRDNGAHWQLQRVVDSGRTACVQSSVVQCCFMSRRAHVLEQVQQPPDHGRWQHRFAVRALKLDNVRVHPHSNIVCLGASLRGNQAPANR